MYHILRFVLKDHSWHAALIIGFSQSEYTVVEDDAEGTDGMSLSICVVIVSSIEPERDFTFYVSVSDSNAIGT